MAELDAKIECMNLWCQGMKIAMMPFEKPRAVGGLPEAWSAEVHHFMTTIHRRVQEMEPIYQKILNSGANLKHKEANLSERIQNMQQEWEGVKMETLKRKEQLEDKLNETIAFQEKLQSFDDWLSCTENMLANLPPVCRRTPNLRAQKREQDALQSDIKSHREALKALKDQRSPLINGQKKDASLINNLLTSLEHRLEGISIKVDNRSRQLKVVLSAHAKFSPSPVRKPAAAAE